MRTPQGLAGTIIVVLVALVALIGPAAAPYNPEEFHITARFRGPGAEYWLGTDQFGRDLLSRILLGARSTLVLCASRARRSSLGRRRSSRGARA